MEKKSQEPTIPSDPYPYDTSMHHNGRSFPLQEPNPFTQNDISSHSIPRYQQLESLPGDKDNKEYIQGQSELCKTLWRCESNIFAIHSKQRHMIILVSVCLFLMTVIGTFSGSTMGITEEVRTQVSSIKSQVDVIHSQVALLQKQSTDITERKACCTLLVRHADVYEIFCRRFGDNPCEEVA